MPATDYLDDIIRQQRYRDQLNDRTTVAAARLNAEFDKIIEAIRVGQLTPQPDRRDDLQKDKDEERAGDWVR